MNGFCLPLGFRNVLDWWLYFIRRKVNPLPDGQVLIQFHVDFPGEMPASLDRICYCDASESMRETGKPKEIIFLTRCRRRRRLASWMEGGDGLRELQAESFFHLTQ